MNIILKFIFILISSVGCTEKPTEEKISDKEFVFNQHLADELKNMAETEQIAAYVPQGKASLYFFRLVIIMNQYKG